MKEKIFCVLSVIMAMVLTVSAIGEGDRDEGIALEIYASGENVYMDEVSWKNDTVIRVNVDGEIREENMEEYLISVVAGEVYPTYDNEALKAQAVAARTYLVYKMNNGGCANGGDICTESSHCQAYKSKETMVSQWGGNYDKYFKAVSGAVYQTSGEIITYNGEAVCALYHSSSVGSTEDCVAVFGGDRPYLKSVSSTVSKESSEYQKEMTFSKAEFINAVNDYFHIDLTGIDIKIISYTSSGRVENLSLGGKTVKATALRKALKLRSTDFTIKKSEKEITFVMHGFGHGVGLSQVGAQEMAQRGADYKEILTHYYTGVKVERLVL